MTRYEVRYDMLPDGTWEWTVWWEHHAPSELPGLLVRVHLGHSPTLAIAVAEAGMRIMWHDEGRK